MTWSYLFYELRISLLASVDTKVVYVGLNKALSGAITQITDLSV